MLDGMAALDGDEIGATRWKLSWTLSRNGGVAYAQGVSEDGGYDEVAQSEMGLEWQDAEANELGGIWSASAGG